MAPTVTIGIPLYTRLTTLPGALRAVQAQTYPHIELLIADNGQHGEALRPLIEQHYRRPYVLRTHPATVDIVANFNSLVEHASGDYFTLLCDDDEISPEFAEELAGLLDAHPSAALAIPMQERSDGEGRLIWRGQSPRPALLSGHDFLRAWSRREYDLVSSTVTQMARTEALRRAGGYPAFPRAVHSDDAIWVKLALAHDVALARRGAFRWRVDAASVGHTSAWRQLAGAHGLYLRFLDEDPYIRGLTRGDPGRWALTRRHLRYASSAYYFSTWCTIYKASLPYGEWLRAGFALAPLPDYYRRVLSTILLPDRLRSLIRRATRSGPVGAERGA